MKITKKGNISLILLVLAIGLSPSFSAGKIETGKALEIRVEDFLMVVLGFIWLASFLLSGKTKIEKPPLFLPIIAWLGIGFFSVLINWILGNIYFTRGFFFFLKEVQFFFIYFYVFYHIKDINASKLFIRVLMLAGLINVGWVIFELVSGLKITYYYGPTPFIEPEGSFPAGGFFLILFLFLFNILLYYYLGLNISRFKKIILFFFILSIIAGILSSGSRASFVGLLLGILVSIFLFFLKRGFWVSFFILIFVFLVIAGIIFLNPDLFNRFFDIEKLTWELNPEGEHSRVWIWHQQILEVSKYPLFFFFGFGKSAILGGIGESHNQYVRNFVETGIIGSLVFLTLIYLIISKSLKSFFSTKDGFVVGVSAGLFCCTLAMLAISLFAEAFRIVKISEVYWFFAATTMAVLAFEKKQMTNL